MTSDWELLERFAKGKDQAAFAEIVQRHVLMVHGAARRMLGASGRDAEDVVQAVFLLLSQKAGRIPQKGAVAGWLFKATRYCCANVKRRDAGRQRHEREAGMQRQEAAATSEDLAPVLDEALGRLGEKERQAILLRYLEGRTTEETGAVLGISVDAAKKRLERGVEKLRGIFASKGFVVPAAGVAGVMMTESAKAAPAGLAITAAGSATGASAAVIGIANGATAMMKLAALKMAAVAAAGAVICLVGGCVIAHSASQNSRTSTISKSGTAVPSSAAAPATVAATQTSPEIESVVEEHSPQLLKEVLAGIENNRKKLKTLKIHSVVAWAFWNPKLAQWTDSARIEGSAWVEASEPRRARFDVPLRRPDAFHVPRRSDEESFVEIWDGSETRRLYGPPYSDPRGEISSERNLLGNSLLGGEFSLQLMRTEGYIGNRKVVDYYTLDPAFLAQMSAHGRLTARRVMLVEKQQAMELEVRMGSSQIDRYWFDPNRGYALLGRWESK